MRAPNWATADFLQNISFQKHNNQTDDIFSHNADLLF